MAGHSKRKWNLWHVNPFCHWCKRLTVPYRSQPVPPLGFEATIDHVFHRFDARRYQPGGDATVLACYDCNQRRAGEDWQRLSDSRVTNRATASGGDNDLTAGAALSPSP